LNPSLIPLPKKYEALPGTFDVSTNTKILFTNDFGRKSAGLLKEYLNVGGFNVLEPIVLSPHLPTPSGTIIVDVKGSSVYDSAGFADESYRIEVTDGTCRIGARNSEGATRGVQTLRQLLASNTSTLAGCRIEDSPRFRWRGLHLDVSRHFFDLAQVQRFIDLAAYYKYNRVHLHLTDDQGWRFESKAFPRLHEIGSKRNETLIGHYFHKPHKFDGIPYGGYYTQQELKELVAYADLREVVLVPEIDIPGHMQAAISAYPEWGCTPGRVGVRETWGISEEILNVEESTIQAMQTIFAEVMDVFPSLFIHVGGDEVPKYRWDTTKRVQERMAEIGVKTEEELQSWFIGRMDSFLQSKGRRLLGWDEILEGGLAPGAAVMSWRGEEGGIEAARLGRDVVMAPEQFTYFDHYQRQPVEQEPLAIGNFTSVEKVYGYEPIPEAIKDLTDKVLGTQGQTWTEYITTQDHLDYMVYPRALALAEVAWTTKEQRDLEDFRRRLAVHQQHLAAIGVKGCWI